MEALVCVGGRLEPKKEGRGRIGKKLPPTMWGAWSEGVLYGEQKGTHPKKVKFFGEIFVLGNYGIFWEK
ncbi:hypothetical protein [uncultured Bilophila sp.]|uniref:hypothetical protein n=1 Tax=uncultured Bilophila sp. TaxID=529385 RepID=UPI00266E93E1|nr:hypothetical protein [uncultured Bilophila sp.]